MITKRILALSTMVLLLTGAVFSQQYNHSLGIRAGLKSGIAYKAFFSDQSAIEVIGLHKQSYSSLTSVYEFHFSPFYSDNIQLFTGIGGHIDQVRPTKGNSFAVIGADAIVGVEYTFDRAPIALSLDVKPALQIIGRQQLDIGWFGVTGRITF